MTGGRGSFREDVRALLRDRVLDAAREITTADGWSAVTMGAVAGRAGISRQHLYHEVGTKQDLGDAMVDRETDGFLALMRDGLRGHPDDLHAGVAAAVRSALVHGAQNTLLKAIVSADTRGESLLPLLTARPDAVLARARDALGAAMHDLHPDLDGDHRLDRLVDGCVRLVLSHLTQPTGPIDDAVEQCRWLAAGVVPGRGEPEC